MEAQRSTATAIDHRASSETVNSTMVEPLKTIKRSFACQNW
jgi:hypothetical protein